MNSCLRSLVVILLAVQCCRSQIAYCKESVASVTFVASCPNSKEEWDRAARKKNCNEMATQQTCAPAENFKYHCVINGYSNALLEVCAPERLILGHCTEFNVIGGIIQDHQSAPCNNGSFPKCDRWYSSSDAYKYPDCYHLVRPTTAPPTTAPKEKPTTDKTSFIIAVIAAIGFTFITMTIVCWKVYSKKKLVPLRVKYRRGKPCNNQQRESGEIAITRSSCSGLSLDQLQSSAKRGSADFHADKDARNLANRDDCELRSTDSKINGSHCCYGFVLNDITGKCEACSSGYHGEDCAIKCQYPTYGESCQSECKCLKNECHYSQGCILHTQIDNEYKRPSSGKTTSTNLISNLTVSNRLVTKVISTEIIKLSDATLITIIREDNFFKNNFVISLLGVFVLFFCIFVLTYVYFKCCRKRTIDNKMTKRDGKTQYLSLSLGNTEQENTVQSTQVRVTDSASLSPAYLTPVSNRYENIETINIHANDVRNENNGVVETTSGQIHPTDQMYPRSEPNISLEDQSENVYNEIYT